jgi:hypothetical protein
VLLAHGCRLPDGILNLQRNASVDHETRSPLSEGFKNKMAGSACSIRKWRERHPLRGGAAKGRDEFFPQVNLLRRGIGSIREAQTWQVGALLG